MTETTTDTRDATSVQGDSHCGCHICDALDEHFKSMPQNATWLATEGGAPPSDVIGQAASIAHSRLVELAKHIREAADELDRAINQQDADQWEATSRLANREWPSALLEIVGPLVDAAYAPERILHDTAADTGQHLDRLEGWITGAGDGGDEVDAEHNKRSQRDAAQLWIGLSGERATRTLCHRARQGGDDG